MQKDRPTTAEAAATIDGFFDDFQEQQKILQDNNLCDEASNVDLQEPADSTDSSSSPAATTEELSMLQEEHCQLSRCAKKVLQSRAQGRKERVAVMSKTDGVETRLHAAVKQWPLVLLDRDRSRAEYQTLIQRLEQEQEEKSARVEGIRKEFERFCVEMAKEITDGNKAAVENVKELLKRGDEVACDLQKKRLVSVGLKSQQCELKNKMAAKDQLGDGLHLMDYEQLKIENQTLEEKIEERNQELVQLKKKISNTVQVLTHVREKLRFVEDACEQEQQIVHRRGQDLLESKKEIQELKIRCAELKQRSESKEKECLRVLDPLLLSDFRDLLNKKKWLEEEIQETTKTYESKCRLADN